MNQLKEVVESLKENKTKDLQIQADMFKTIIYANKRKSTEKLRNVQQKLALLKRQTKRKEITLNTKIQVLLNTIKKMNILNNDSYEILKDQFGHMSVELFKNESKNKNKSVYARRFSPEVKKFALKSKYKRLV